MLIAAITSCTNTSNPAVLIAAGLLARNAHQRGLATQPWVKTSLSPGSRVVTDYLDRAGLTAELQALGFYTAGYGCQTCIGNSGPLKPEISEAVRQADVIACAVLSGNRNFEGRVHPEVRMNFLASPPLVVAYALAGTLDLDLNTEPLGKGRRLIALGHWDSWGKRPKSCRWRPSNESCQVLARDGAATDARRSVRHSTGRLPASAR